MGRGEGLHPNESGAKLLRYRVVTEPHAVFSPQPGGDTFRPPQTTCAANLFLAGDWTQTGWPATMEGAVRSGYLAAWHLCRSVDPALAPQLPRDVQTNWLTMMLLRRG